MPSAQQVENFSCSPAEFFAIVKDYERYPEFLQEVRSCRILKEEPIEGGVRKLVEYKVSIIKTFGYQLWMNERAPHLVSWEFAGGDLFKTSTGSWALAGDTETRATYSVDATFAMFVPGPIAKTLMNVNLPTMMAAYRKRVKDLYGK